MARPSKYTPELMDRLRQAFLLGASYKEASLFSGISEKTLKNYIRKDDGLLPQIELWRAEPTLKAKQTIMGNIHLPKVAMWYLERKSQDFKPKQHIGSDTPPIPILLGISKQEATAIHTE